MSYIDVNIHVFPIPILPPTSLSTRSLWVFPVHQARALVSCILPGLVICFTLDNIHFSMLFSENIPSSPSPTESKSLFCTSMSLFLCFIYCLSDLYYFLPSTDFRFCLFFFFLILLGGRLGCLFEFCFSFFFFFFWGRHVSLCIPLRTALVTSHRFCMVFVFSLSSVSRYFLISFLIASLADCFFRNLLLSIHVIAFFFFFFSFLSLCLSSSFVLSWWEKMFDKMLVLISIFLILLRHILLPNTWSILENVLCAFEKNVYYGFF